MHDIIFFKKVCHIVREGCVCTYGKTGGGLALIVEADLALALTLLDPLAQTRQHRREPVHSLVGEKQNETEMREVRFDRIEVGLHIKTQASNNITGEHSRLYQGHFKKR